MSESISAGDPKGTIDVGNILSWGLLLIPIITTIMVIIVLINFSRQLSIAKDTGIRKQESCGPEYLEIETGRYGIRKLLGTNSWTVLNGFYKTFEFTFLLVAIGILIQAAKMWFSDLQFDINKPFSIFSEMFKFSFKEQNYHLVATFGILAMLAFIVTPFAMLIKKTVQAKSVVRQQAKERIVRKVNGAPVSESLNLNLKINVNKAFSNWISGLMGGFIMVLIGFVLVYVASNLHEGRKQLQWGFIGAFVLVGMLGSIISQMLTTEIATIRAISDVYDDEAAKLTSALNPLKARQYFKDYLFTNAKRVHVKANIEKNPEFVFTNYEEMEKTLGADKMYMFLMHQDGHEQFMYAYHNLQDANKYGGDASMISALQQAMSRVRYLDPGISQSNEFIRKIKKLATLLIAIVAFIFFHIMFVQMPDDMTTYSSIIILALVVLIATYGWVSGNIYS